MVSGSIGKIGNAYTIDAKMFAVSTGAAESMKNITYAGAVEGLIIEIEILAWDILGLDPPRALKRKRNQGIPDYSAVGVNRKTKIGALVRSIIPGFGQIYSGNKVFGYGFMVLEAGMIGMVAKSNADYTSYENEYNTQLVNYNAATVPAEIASYKALVNQARDDMISASDQLTLFSAAAGGVFLISAIHAYITGPTIAEGPKQLPIRLAYDPTLKYTQLKWVISL